MTDGDIIRVGRAKFKVSIINAGNRLQNSYPSARENVGTCRFCLTDTNTISNPLISICKCKGTAKYIHLECVKAWLKYQLHVFHTTEYCSYYWRTFSCELCKEKYHPDMAEFELPITGPYMVLENMTSTKDHSVHVLAPTDGVTTYKVGRGHKADIKVNDLSVSRVHSFISYINGEFTLRDNNSKFGTLVLLREKQDVGVNRIMSVQINKVLLTFSVRSCKITGGDDKECN